jgi:hypothetical protein
MGIIADLNYSYFSHTGQKNHRLVLIFATGKAVERSCEECQVEG